MSRYKYAKFVPPESSDPVLDPIPQGPFANRTVIVICRKAMEDVSKYVLPTTPEPILRNLLAAMETCDLWLGLFYGPDVPLVDTGDRHDGNLAGAREDPFQQQWPRVLHAVDTAPGMIQSDMESLCSQPATNLVNQAPYATDSSTDLPDVVLDLIMKFCRKTRKEREHTSQCVDRRDVASLVCRSWRNAALRSLRRRVTLYTDEDLFAHILQQTHLRKFVGATPPSPQMMAVRLNRKDLQYHIGRSSYDLLAIYALDLTLPLRSLELGEMDLTSDEMIGLLVKCAGLKHLHFRGNVVGSFDKCSAPTQLAAQRVSQLKSLHWTTKSDSSNAALFVDWLFKSTGPALREVTAKDCGRDGGSGVLTLGSGCANVKYLNTFGVWLQMPQAWCNSLRVLIIHDGIGPAFRNVCEAFRFCHNLEIVFGWWNEQNDQEAFVKAIAPLRKLRHVLLRNFTWTSERTFEQFLINNGGNLRYVVVGNYVLSRRILQCVAERCVGLEYVHFQDLADWMGGEEEWPHLVDDVLELVRSCRHLKGVIHMPYAVTTDDWRITTCEEGCPCMGCKLQNQLCSEGFGDWWNRTDGHYEEFNWSHPPFDEYEDH